MWGWPDGSPSAFPHPSLVRILLPSDENDAELVAELALALLARRLDVDRVAAPARLVEELGYARQG
jgi:hypothetical protein